MRNLKRVLSLSLASIMLLGMMVIGTSAASDYSDVDYDNDNVEAIEVLNAIGVMNGDLDSNGNLAGTFRPGDEVKRSEMARIMAFLMDLDYDYYIGANPFNDMVGHWAEGYAAACYANGIIAGRTNTTYDPNATVTAVEAAAMLMRALGYFQNKDVDYADGFEISTVRQAGRINLFNKVDAKTNEPMTRNDVAQLVLNALQSGMVELSTNNKIDVTVGDAQVTIGSSNYVYTVARDPAVGRAINRTKATQGNSSTGLEGEILDLGEKLYDGKLKLNDDIDAFKRPVRRWELDGEEIGKYIKEELLVYNDVGAVSGKALYDLLGSNVVDNYKLSVALDGVRDPAIVRRVAGDDASTDNSNYYYNSDYVFDASDINRNNKANVGDTGTGVLVQVFVDNEADEAYIAIINTYLARASQDYDKTREVLPVTGYAIRKDTPSGEYVKRNKSGTATEPFRVPVEDFPMVANAVEKDAFLFTIAEGEIQTFEPAEVLEGMTISSFKRNDNVVADGTTYKFTTTAGFDAETLDAYTGGDVINLKDVTYNIYLDAYKNLIGVEKVEAANNYVFITGINLNDSNLVNGVADARGIFLDGTVETIRVNMSKSDLATYGPHTTPATDYERNSILNTWCTYTVNNNDVYTLRQVSDVGSTKGGASWGAVPGGTNAVNGKTNSTKLAQYHQTTDDSFDIDKKHITLHGKTPQTGEFAYVYGNENTVYITAELEKLINKYGPNPWGVISDVDTVTVGIENANLEVWDEAGAMAAASGTGTILTGDTSEGVYTLYNKDGIVIAAVVVGEDNGSAKNLVYVHSSTVNYEAYNGETTKAAGDGMWTWTRDVIYNGEVVTLTEVSEGNSELAQMKQYEWYQVKANSNGEVTGVLYLPGMTYEKGTERLKPASSLIRSKDYALTWDDKYTPDWGEKEAPAKGARGEITYAIQEGSNIILYWNDATIKSQMRMNGRTLYVHTKDESGFIVANNVNWVIQRWDNNKKETYLDEGTGATSLKNMIDEINNRYNNKDWEYHVGAIIENGIASSVVIYDTTNDYTRTPVFGDNYVDREDGNGIVDTTGKVFYYHVAWGNDIDDVTIDDVLAAVIAYKGWTWDAARGDRITGDNANGYTIRYNGVTYTVYLIKDADPNPKKEITVAIDDKAAEDIAALTEDDLFEGKKPEDVKITIGGTEMDEDSDPETIPTDKDLTIQVDGVKPDKIVRLGLTKSKVTKALPEYVWTKPADEKGVAVATIEKADLADLADGTEILVTEFKVVESYTVTVNNQNPELVKVDYPAGAADKQVVKLTIAPAKTIAANETITVTITGSATDTFTFKAGDEAKTVTFTMGAEAATVTVTAESKIEQAPEAGKANLAISFAGDSTAVVTITGEGVEGGTKTISANETVPVTEKTAVKVSAKGANPTDTVAISASSGETASALDTAEINIAAEKVTGNVTITVTVTKKAGEVVPTGPDQFARVDTSVTNEGVGTIYFYNHPTGTTITAIPEDKIENLIKNAIAEVNGNIAPTTVAIDKGVVTATFPAEEEGGDPVTLKFDLVTATTATGDGSTKYPFPVYKINVKENGSVTGSAYLAPDEISEDVLEADGTTIILKGLGTENQLYMWDDRTYISQGESAEGVFVFAADDTGLVIEDPSQFDQTNYSGYDLTFIEAVQLSEAKNDLTTGLDAEATAGEILTGGAVLTVGSSTLDGFTLAGGDYFPKNASLTVQVMAAPGEAAKIRVNGASAPLTSTSKNSGEAAAPVPITITVVGKDGTSVMEIEKVTAAFKVMINGYTIKDTDGVTDKWFTGSETEDADVKIDVKDATKYGVLNVNDILIVVPKDHSTAGSIVAADDNSGTIAIPVTGTVGGSARGLDITTALEATPDDDDCIRLVKAYSVESADASIIATVAKSPTKTMSTTRQEASIDGDSDGALAYVVVGNSSSTKPTVNTYVEMAVPEDGTIGTLVLANNSKNITSLTHNSTRTDSVSGDKIDVYAATIAGNVDVDNDNEVVMATLKLGTNTGSFDYTAAAGAKQRLDVKSAAWDGESDLEIAFATENAKALGVVTVTATNNTNTGVKVKEAAGEVALDESGDFSINLTKATEDATVAATGKLITLEVSVPLDNGSSLKLTVEVYQFSD